MFDILPDEAFPSDPDLSRELQEAKIAATALFAPLNASPERDSALSSLGRLGTNSLKKKVRHRAKVLLDRTGDRFLGIEIIADQAVNCRNHYVHGSKSKIHYENNGKHLVPILIDTLEFIFVTSDLIDCGWEVERWLECSGTLDHPIQYYAYSFHIYKQHVSEFLGKS